MANLQGDWGVWAAPNGRLSVGILGGGGIPLCANRIRARLEFFRLERPVQLAQQLRVAIEYYRDVRVVRTEHGFQNGDRALIQRLSVGQFPFSFVELRDIGQRESDGSVAGSQSFF